MEVDNNFAEVYSCSHSNEPGRDRFLCLYAGVQARLEAIRRCEECLSTAIRLGDADIIEVGL